MIRYNKRKMVIVAMSRNEIVRNGMFFFVTAPKQQEEVAMRFILSTQIEPALAFHLMKFAFQVLKKEVVELTMEEYTEIYLQACHEMILHEKILLSEAACGVVVPKKTVQATCSILETEYGGRENFFRHLEKNNLQPDDYLTALDNDLKVEAILARVAFQAEPVSAQEVHDYYHSHQDSFCLPEQRSARHPLFREAIHPGARLHRQEACQQIHQTLTREKRITACRTWLKSLFHNLR